MCDKGKRLIITANSFTKIDRPMDSTSCDCPDRKIHLLSEPIRLQDLLSYTHSGLEIKKNIKSPFGEEMVKIVAKCKFLVAKSNRRDTIRTHT